MARAHFVPVVREAHFFPLGAGGIPPECLGGGQYLLVYGDGQTFFWVSKNLLAPYKICKNDFGKGPCPV